MDLIHARNLCRKAAVVGGRCADDLGPSISRLLQGTGSSQALRPLRKIIVDVMIEKIQGQCAGSFDVGSNCFRLANGHGCFRFLPILDGLNANRQNKSVGTICTYHQSGDSACMQLAAAATYLGQKKGVLHASLRDGTLSKNYRRLPGVDFFSQQIDGSDTRLGIGTLEDWHLVPPSVISTMNSAGLRPLVASPMVIVHALVFGQLTSALFHIPEAYTKAVVEFYLLLATVPVHEIEVMGECLQIYGKIPEHLRSVTRPHVV